MSDVTEFDELHLGSGMARRSRSQSVLARHRTAATLVGAVGRASVGFSLAVGRSRAIRPIVNLSDVNSAALRPPTNFWREPISEYTTGDTATSETATGDTATGTRSLVGGGAARRSTTPAQESAATARAIPVPRRSEGHRRPTWTDQIIHRSAVGYTSAPAGALIEPPPVPDDFVPFGDAAIDHLRLLVRARESSATQAPTRSEPVARRPVARRAVDDSAGADPVASDHDAGGPNVGAQRGDTAAGRSTGPGQFAKAMRPEQVTSRATSGLEARPGPGSTVGADRPTERRADPAEVRRAPQRPAAAPSRMETLRALLVERGILSGGPDDAPPASSDVVTSDAATPGRTTSSEPTGSEPEPAARAATTSADLQRSARRSAEQRRDTRSERTPADTAMDGPGPLRPVSSPQSGPRRTDPSGSDPSGSEGASPVGAAESVAGVPRSQDPISSRDVAGLRRRALRMVSTSSEPARRDAAAGERSNVAVADVVADVDGDAVEPRAHASTRFEQFEPTSTSRTLDRATHPPLPWAPQRPVLRSLSPAPMPGTTVLRRVTLPRAMSFSHRPAPTLGAAGVPSVGVAGDVRSEPAGARISGGPAGAVIARADVDSPAAWDMADAASVIDRPSTVVSDRPQSVRASVSPLAEGATARERRETAPDGRVATPGAHLARRRSVLAASSGALHQAIRRRGAPASPVTSPVSQGSAGPAVRAPLVPGTTTPDAPTPDTTAPDATAPGVATPPMRTSSATTSAATTPVARSASSPGAERAGAAALGAAVTRPPAERLADQFMTELSHTIRRTPAPLPMPYRSMADEITGGRRVMLSTDGASRRALRSVGKVAATTDDTIHLDPTSVASRRMTEVIAHELTHVAHPSPTPRFFDDIDHSPEERQAEQVAKIMARSPLAPSASVVTPAGLQRRAAPTIRRSPTSSSSTGSANGTVDAVSLAARITGTSHAGSPPIRRTPDIATPTNSPTNSPTIRRALENESPSPSVSGGSASAPMSDREFLDLLRANLPDVLAMIEDRMIIELERRGGRTWGVL